MHRRTAKCCTLSSLGVSQGDVCVIEEIGRADRVIALRQRHSDTRAQVVLAAADVDRWSKTAGDGVGDQAQLVPVGDAVAQRCELVPAEARHHVARTYGSSQAIGDDAERFIAREVAEAVVELLEVVEVDQRTPTAPPVRWRICIASSRV